MIIIKMLLENDNDNDDDDDDDVDVQSNTAVRRTVFNVTTPVSVFMEVSSATVMTTVEICLMNRTVIASILWSLKVHVTMMQCK